MKKLVILLFVFALFSSCFPTHTTDAEKAFEHWAGFQPPDDFRIIEGEYYKSPHFTYEFEVYLKIIPTEEWWLKLKEQYKLSEDYQPWTKPEKAPDWFTPSSKLVMYSRHDPLDQSRFFKDSVSRGVYVYEVQY